MEVRWKWKWDEKLLNQNTRRGTQKKRGRRKHQHQHTWPGTGKPWKGKRKEKRRPTGKNQQTSGGGGRQKRLNQPNKAKPNAYLRTRRTQTYLKKGATREITDPWGLVDETNTKACMGSSSMLLRRSNLCSRTSPWSGLPRRLTQLPRSINWCTI